MFAFGSVSKHRTEEQLQLLSGATPLSLCCSRHAFASSCSRMFTEPAQDAPCIHAGVIDAKHTMKRHTLQYIVLTMFSFVRFRCMRISHKRVMAHRYAFCPQAENKKKSAQKCSSCQSARTCW